MPERARTLRAALITLLGLLPTMLVANEATVVAEIERHADAQGVMVGVSALHLPSGKQVRVNGDAAFPLASTYKVPMAAHALHLVSQGELSLDQLIEVKPEDLVVSSSITRLFPHPGIQLSLLNLIEATLIQSDNTATDVLLRTIGGGEAVTAWLEASGIDGMRVDRNTADLIRDYMEIPRSNDSMAAQYQAQDFDHLEEADWIGFYEALLADPRDQGTPDAMVNTVRRCARSWPGA
jgi:beta-lactamase class A